VDTVSPAKRVEIARAYYRQALRAVRAESTPETWARLVWAARGLSYAIAAAENAAADAARREPGRG
jgi:hypothetical protein